MYFLSSLVFLFYITYHCCQHLVAEKQKKHSKNNQVEKILTDFPLPSLLPLLASRPMRVLHRLWYSLNINNHGTLGININFSIKMGSQYSCDSYVFIFTVLNDFTLPIASIERFVLLYVNSFEFSGHSNETSPLTTIMLKRS